MCRTSEKLSMMKKSLYCTDIQIPKTLNNKIIIDIDICKIK